MNATYSQNLFSYEKTLTVIFFSLIMHFIMYFGGQEGSN